MNTFFFPFSSLVKAICLKLTWSFNHVHYLLLHVWGPRLLRDRGKVMEREDPGSVWAPACRPFPMVPTDDRLMWGQAPHFLTAVTLTEGSLMCPVVNLPLVLLVYHSAAHSPCLSSLPIRLDHLSPSFTSTHGDKCLCTCVCVCECVCVREQEESGKSPIWPKSVHSHF